MLSGCASLWRGGGFFKFLFMNRQVVKEGMCECDTAPMGDGGLEGFDEKQQYRYQQMLDKIGVYYRVYHQGDDNYFETCNPGIFKRHFRILTDT
jgi:hypothetical protein